MSDLDAMLGIDRNDPIQAHAFRLAEGDDKFLDDIVAIRESHMTRAEVAEKLGVTEADIARIESGERDPHLSTLRRYALAIGAEVTHAVTASPS